MGCMQKLPVNRSQKVKMLQLVNNQEDGSNIVLGIVEIPEKRCKIVENMIMIDKHAPITHPHAPDRQSRRLKKHG
eukprot:638957-Alexandrium_andersonii.AAC.1